MAQETDIGRIDIRVHVEGREIVDAHRRGAAAAGKELSRTTGERFLAIAQRHAPGPLGGPLAISGVQRLVQVLRRPAGVGFPGPIGIGGVAAARGAAASIAARSATMALARGAAAAGLALAGVTVAAGVAGAGFAKLVHVLERQAAVIGALSPAIMAAQVRAQVATLRVQLERGRVAGPALARLVDNLTRLRVAFAPVKTAALLGGARFANFMLGDRLFADVAADKQTAMQKSLDLLARIAAGPFLGLVRDILKAIKGTPSGAAVNRIIQEDLAALTEGATVRYKRGGALGISRFPTRQKPGVLFPDLPRNP